MPKRTCPNLRNLDRYVAMCRRIRRWITLSCRAHAKNARRKVFFAGSKGWIVTGSRSLATRAVPVARGRQLAAMDAKRTQEGAATNRKQPIRLTRVGRAER